MESLNDFKDKSPAWASGCPACQYGLVAAPEIISTLPLSEQRAVEAAEDMILFCDCRAGFMYRQYLRKVYATLNMNSRKNIRDHILAALQPTVHGEPA